MIVRGALHRQARERKYRIWDALVVSPLGTCPPAPPSNLYPTDPLFSSTTDRSQSVMIRRSRWLGREERLALFCSLLVTSALAFFLQQLKEDRGVEGTTGNLVEYREFSVPPGRRRTPSGMVRMRSPDRAQRPQGSLGLAVSVDSTQLTQKDRALPSSVPSGRNGFPVDSTGAQPGLLLHNHNSDMVLDSIFKTDSITRQMLLRQHLQYSSSIYDTASVLHLVRFSQVIRRFDDQPVSFEESTQRNLRRYGHPYNPVRPQPPTVQVPLEGILSRLLGYIF
jgi:hypothetical protein